MDRFKTIFSLEVLRRGLPLTLADGVRNAILDRPACELGLYAVIDQPLRFP